MKSHYENEFDELVVASRDAFPEIEASPGFVAEVWRKIEERRAQSWVSLIGQWSPKLALVGAAAALLLAASSALSVGNSSEDLLESTYVDALTEDSLEEDDNAMWIVAGNR